MTWHNVAGLRRTIWLPDHIRFTQRILPASQTNQRPGYKLWGTPQWIQHETGNYRPGTDAENHARYLEGGAMARDANGALYSQQLGYHFCSDDAAIYQMVPADEVTWQAACGACAGNYDCWSNEQAVNPETDQVKARDVSEWLAAAMLEAGGIAADPGNITRHYDWNDVYGDPNHPKRHRCPELMIRDGYWPTFQQNVIHKMAVIAGHRVAVENPVPPIPAPQYADAVLPEWFSQQDAREHPTDQKFRNRTAYVCKRNFKALAGTVRRAEPTTAAPKSGPSVAAGDKVFGIRLWVNPDDTRTWILEETGHWLLASRFSPRVRIDPRSVE